MRLCPRVTLHLRLTVCSVVQTYQACGKSVAAAALASFVVDVCGENRRGGSSGGRTVAGRSSARAGR